MFVDLTPLENEMNALRKQMGTLTLLMEHLIEVQHAGQVIDTAILQTLREIRDQTPPKEPR